MAGDGGTAFRLNRSSTVVGTVLRERLWFAWEGSLLRFGYRTDRQKFRNLQRESRV